MDPKQHPCSARIDKLLSFLLSQDFNSPEEWREIDWIDSNYFVSSKGRVLSLCNKSPRILKPYTSGNGYLAVSIGGQDRRIHRLVAKGFLPNPEGKRVVHHTDGDKKNNMLKNLTWATHQENTLAYYEEKRRKQDEANSQKILHSL